MTNAWAIHQAAWAEKMLNGGESDNSRPLGLTPLETYRSGTGEISKPPTIEVLSTPAQREAYFGENFSRKQDRDLAVAGIADAAMCGLLDDSELAHIFTGAAVDFDTIHELQQILHLAIQDAYMFGFTAGFEAVPSAETAIEE